MGFWILAVLAVVIVVAVIGYAMLSPGGQTAQATAAYDVQVYRDQLKELDRDLARGTIDEDEARRSRVEVSRRLLEADRAQQAATAAPRAPGAATWTAIALLAAFVLGGGLIVYDKLGQPGYWDMPLAGRIAAADTARAERPSQAAAEAELPAWAGPPAEAPQDYVDLVTQLRDTVATRPDDIQGHVLLATHETALGNYVGAHRALARAIELKGDAALAEDYSQYADLLVLAAGGYVSPEAEEALTQSLRRDPNDPVARYYSGLMFAQVGRPDMAFRLWRDLLEQSAPTDPWVEPIRAQIPALAAMAGVDYTPPALGTPPMAGMPGPSADDVAAAQDMTDEERAEMISGMVSRLLDRLATEGGPASDWARAISVLGVQGDLERASAIYQEALGVFAGQDEDLATLRAAAQAAGIAP